MYRILVVDDHDIVRDGIKFTLEAVEDFEVVDEAINGVEAMQMLSKHSYDVVLTDIRMPDMDGLQLLEHIKTKFPQQLVIILSMHNDSAYLKKAISLGADGFILKRSSRRDIHDALNKVIGGGTYFSMELYDQLVHNLSKRGKNKRLTYETELTNREREILDLIVKEMSNKEMAEALSVSVRTIETHKHNLLTKTGCKNIAGLVLYAIEKDMV